MIYGLRLAPDHSQSHIVINFIDPCYKPPHISPEKDREINRVALSILKNYMCLTHKSKSEES